MSVGTHSCVVLLIGQTQDLLPDFCSLVELGAVVVEGCQASEDREQLGELSLPLEQLEGAGVCVLDLDRKSTRLNSSHSQISYAVFCLKKKKSMCKTLVLLAIVSSKKLPETHYYTCTDYSATVASYIPSLQSPLTVSATS